MHRVRGLVLLLIIGIVVAIFMSLPKGTLSLENIQYYQGQLKQWQNGHPGLAISSFFLVYFLISALSIPGTRILSLLAGALFGLTEGVLLVLVAASTGAAVALLLSRYFLRDWVQRRFVMMMNIVNKGMAENGAYYLFAVRLVPVLPFSIINLLVGLTPFPVLRFMGITFIGLLPSVILYISTGQQLSQVKHMSDILSPQIIVLFLLLGLLPLLARLMMKRIMRQPRHPEE